MGRRNEKDCLTEGAYLTNAVTSDRECWKIGNGTIGSSYFVSLELLFSTSKTRNAAVQFHTNDFQHLPPCAADTDTLSLGRKSVVLSEIMWGRLIWSVV